jgi:hypothetical protein
MWIAAGAGLWACRGRRVAGIYASYQGLEETSDNEGAFFRVRGEPNSVRIYASSSAMCYKFSAFDLNSADFYVPSVGAR